MAEVKLLATELVKDDFDYSQRFYLFENENKETLTLLDVLRYFQIAWSNSGKNKANSHLKGYRDSGLWYRFWKYTGQNGTPIIPEGRNETRRKTLIVAFQVGCACSRDCCGHVCGLRYEFSVLSDEFIVVIEKRDFNY